MSEKVEINMESWVSILQNYRKCADEILDIFEKYEQILPSLSIDLNVFLKNGEAAILIAGGPSRYQVKTDINKNMCEIADRLVNIRKKQKNICDEGARYFEKKRTLEASLK